MRRTDFLWIILLVGLAWNLGAAQHKQIDIDADPEWIEVQHESGTQYIMRTKSIIGMVSPTPGDPKKRNGILLQNGFTITTELDLPDFKQIIEAEDQEVKSVKR